MTGQPRDRSGASTPVGTSTPVGGTWFTRASAIRLRLRDSEKLDDGAIVPRRVVEPSGIRASSAPLPRSRIGIGVEPELRESLASRAHGRVLVIDYFATRRCSVAIGDLTASFRLEAPGPAYVELAEVAGVRLLVEKRLLGILDDAEPTLGLSRPPFARHVSISLGRPELWIDFLERPGILSGKGPLRSGSR